MKRGIFASALITLLLAGSASARTTIIEPAGSHLPYQRWIEKSKVATPNEEVTVIEKSMSDPDWPCIAEYGIAQACALQESRTIYMAYPHTWYNSARFIFSHELGHLFDAAEFTPDNRWRFSQLTGYPVDPWLSATLDWNTHHTAGERFAEAYAVCAIYGLHIHEPRMTLSFYPPDVWVGKRLNFQLCTLVNRAATS